MRRRYVRRRLTRNHKLAATAITAGLLLAALRGHAPPPAGGGGGGNEALANSMAAAAPYHWAGSQATCLDELWTRENSQWDPTQWNLGGSGAYGIPQALPAAKIRWGLGYIAATYGTPCGAWSHEETAGWY